MSPTLKTIRMVESELKKADGFIKVAELKRKLPKKVNHTVLMEILEYLEQIGHIGISLKGVLYIYNPSKKLQQEMVKGYEISAQDLRKNIGREYK